MTVQDTRPQACDLSLEEFLAGPGGYTSREFEGHDYVSEDQYLWASDFAYCAVHRLELALVEAERRGISRETMEAIMRHKPETPGNSGGAA